MRANREMASDDLVLAAGPRPSEYAGSLLEIARRARLEFGVPSGVVAMAESSNLGQRISSIADADRSRDTARRGAIMGAFAVAACLTLALGGCQSGKTSHEVAPEADRSVTATEPAGFHLDPRLQRFVIAKEKQAREFVKTLDLNVAPETWASFEAAKAGDWPTVNRLFQQLRARAYQYEGVENPDKLLMTPVWLPLLELYMVYEQFAEMDLKFIDQFSTNIINSIPPGSIYFGGTDPGRGLITGLTESHVDGEPFFTITQNALADGNYLNYLRLMYGEKIHTPTKDDSQKSFQQYVDDAKPRLKHDQDKPKEPKQIRPGENVSVDPISGKVSVSGQTAVMAINGLTSKVIFDKNPTREFFIEESFPLDWMYPHLTPFGNIMKINREPVVEMTAEIVAGDHAHWSAHTGRLIGDWIDYDTTVSEVVKFARKAYLERDDSDFRGDPDFLRDERAQGLFSKSRNAIAELYAWRIREAGRKQNLNEQRRMTKEADFAFKQAFALCPYSAEVVLKYTDLLILLAEDDPVRLDDAITITQLCHDLKPDNTAIDGRLAKLIKKRTEL